MRIAKNVGVVPFNSDGVLYYADREDAQKLLEQKSAVPLQQNSRRCISTIKLTSEQAKKPKADVYYPPTPSGVNSFKLSSSVAATVSRSEAKRIAVLTASVGSHTEYDWVAVLDRYGNKCLRCEVSGSDEPLTKDHITPLSEGGTDYASNLQPLCRSCNSWKGNREIDFRGVRAYAAA